MSLSVRSLAAATLLIVATVAPAVAGGSAPAPRPAASPAASAQLVQGPAGLRELATTVWQGLFGPSRPAALYTGGGQHRNPSRIHQPPHLLGGCHQDPNGHCIQ